MKEAVGEAGRRDLVVRVAAHLQVAVHHRVAVRRLRDLVRPEEAQLAGRPEEVVDRLVAAPHSEVALHHLEAPHRRSQPTSKPSGSSALELVPLAAISK